MRQTTVALILSLLVGSSAFAASRHYVLTPDHVLSGTDVEALAERGISLLRPMSDGRYLIRAASPLAVEGLDVERVTPQKKVYRDAMRAVTSGRPVAHINVVFHDDVPFDAARSMILEVGGVLEETLQTDFMIPRRIAARVPSQAVMRLAADERVLLIRGPMRLRIASNNANAAALSTVNLVQAAPYNLTGSGVALSYFELAAADAAHPEFGGRLTPKFTGGPTSEAKHATHVGGTMIASGINTAAKGMAPNATLIEFRATDDDAWDKKEALKDFSVVADNNSWSFIVGWCEPSDCDGNWRWEDTEELLGGYDVFYTAPLDQIARSANVLMVHSSGNEATKFGPTVPPFSHKHSDDQGKEIPNKTFCYPVSPATTCPTPCTDCEQVRHPVNAPFESIGPTASAKNVMTVGAVDGSKNVLSFSSRGPMRDGRIKPELVARGLNLFSTVPSGRYEGTSGTSMSAPVVTGTAALLAEQWRRTFGSATLNVAALKTLLIAGAEDIGPAGPDYTAGFGLLQAKASIDLILADNAAGRTIKVDAIGNGSQVEYPVTLLTAQKLRVVLGWADPEVLIFPDDGVAVSALVNDLDVKVIDPAGNTILPYVLDRANPSALATRGVNTIDNTEMVEIDAAAPGRYRILVTGRRVTAQAPQLYALVTNGDMSPIPVCSDGNEPNGSTDNATHVASGSAIPGRLCASDDIDNYTFTANIAGPVTVNVTATDTPLRVTLTRDGTTVATADVPAGETRFVGSSGTGVFNVRVEPTGSALGDAAYAITATYNFDTPNRRRAARR
ncbi:MAG: S8 family serine peptidase [Thermoanaerobaculia bacterium]|nr:S8 family serine peptidase [Thermoanaerobaculia bacterium]